MQSQDADTSCGAGSVDTELVLTPDGQYRIDDSEMGLLGSGAHGVVRIAQHVTTLDYVAVKIMPTSVIRTACKEVMALTRLNHPHVVQLLSVQVDMLLEKVYVLMELCQGGELFDRIAECGGLNEAEAKRYFVQILSALSHCHDNRVFHRDLKPENILLDAEDNAKVADFGLAAVYRHVADDATFLRHTKVGSVMYAAPEVLTSTAGVGYDASCADMWSLGVILFSMLSGTLPFQCAAASRCKRYAAVLRQGIQVMCPEHLSPLVTELLGQMLDPDPSRRFTPAEALQCEWLSAALPLQMPPLAGGHTADMRSWTVTLPVPENVSAVAPACAGCSSCGASAVSQRACAHGGGGGELSAQWEGEDSNSKRKRVEVTETSREGPQGKLHAAVGADGRPTSSDESSGMSAAGAVPFDGSSHCCGAIAGSTRDNAVGAADGNLSQCAPGGGASLSSQCSPLGSTTACEGGPSAVSAAASSAPAASGSAIGGSSCAGIQAQPMMNGYLADFASQWRWGPLPPGTEQLLGDILQTLRSMGLQYTLQEQHTGPGESVCVMGAASSIAATATDVAATTAAEVAAVQARRIVLKIHFTATSSTRAPGTNCDQPTGHRPPPPPPPLFPP